MITANTVADYFLAFANECEELITNLKLNKLVYYTQAWHLALFREPMFEGEIEAWVHGSVMQKYFAELLKLRTAVPIAHDTIERAEHTILSERDTLLVLELLEN